MTRARVAVGCLLVSVAAAAQQYVISTFAGGLPPATPAPALSVSIPSPQGIAADAAGNAYFIGFGTVFKVDQKGILTRVAGNYRPGYSGDGGPATKAQLSTAWPFDSQALAVDGAGNLFIADGNRIRRVSPDGIITTVAGNGVPGFSGDGGPATDSRLSFPWSLAVDGAGNLFIADSLRVRKIAPSGIITTVAGNGTQGFSGDGGPAAAAQLDYVAGLAVDRSGNLIIADRNRIRKVPPSGIITTVAGNGRYGYSGDGGPAIDAQLGYPQGLAADKAGNLFITDGGSIRKIAPSGIITTVAGSSTPGFFGDGGPAISAQLNAAGIAVDHAGNLFIADYSNRRIRKISTDGVITSIAGDGGPITSFWDSAGAFSGDGGPAASAQLNQPTDVAVDRAGNVLITDLGNHRIRKVSPSGTITTVAGDGSSSCHAFSPNTCPLPEDGGTAIGAQLNRPLGVAVDGAGNFFIADSGNGRIRKVSPDGIITTVAGNGICCYSGDGGPATSAQLNPGRVAVDATGNLFIITSVRIRKVAPDGVITTVAGNGRRGFSGDDGPATSATLNVAIGDNDDPYNNGGLDVDDAGDLFIADTYNNRVRKVSPDGIITTVAGNGICCYSGDGGPASSASLGGPRGIALDGAGNLFIASYGSIRKVSPDGIITTVAGNGSFLGYSGDGGPATSVTLGGLRGIALDGVGNIYFADTYYNAVRVLRPTNHSLLIGSVLDAASQRAAPVSPGEIVVINGAGLGPSRLLSNQPSQNQFDKEAGGTTVSFNGIAAPIIYTSATQVAAVVPYSVTGTTVQVTVSYEGEVSSAFSVPVAASAPGIFTSNQSGAGQAAAVNADGTVNTAVNPVKIGETLSLYATGAGQTAPGGVDGMLGGAAPILAVKVKVGGIPASVQYAGGAPGQVAGLIQVNVQIPAGVQPGGYVPVVLQVGDASTTPGAVWIAVSGN